MRFRSICSLSFLLGAALCACAAMAHAAAIASPALHAKAVKADGKVSAHWPTDPVQCDLILSGDIKEGDADELARQFRAISEGSNSFSFFLCLRSEGGSVPEAIKIAKIVLRSQR